MPHGDERSQNTAHSRSGACELLRGFCTRSIRPTENPEGPYSLQSSGFNYLVERANRARVAAEAALFEDECRAAQRWAVAGKLTNQLRAIEIVVTNGIFTHIGSARAGQRHQPVPAEVPGTESHGGAGPCDRFPDDHRHGPAFLLYRRWKSRERNMNPAWIAISDVTPHSGPSCFLLVTRSRAVTRSTACRVSGAR